MIKRLESRGGLSFQLKKYEGIHFKLIEDLQQKIYKRIPFNFYLGSIYKGFPLGKKFEGKPL